MKFYLLSLIGAGVASSAYLKGSFTAGTTVYEDQTASEKFNYLLNKITGDKTPGPWPSLIGWPPSSTLAGLFLESMTTTVSLLSDEMPADRYKLIHSVGGAASFKIEWNDNPYTGLFQGADYGLMRLASATQPKEGSESIAVESAFVPGIGIKMLRDGVPSANCVFLHKLTPADSWNFFKHSQSNHLSANNLGVAEKALKAKFETSGSNWVNMVGISDFARYDQKGNEVPSDKLNFPFQLVIIPTSEMGSMFPDTYDRPLIDQLRSIKSGTVLYEIHAKSDYDSELVNIGKLVLTSNIESSVFADTKLFLKHQIMEEDFKLRPEWLKRCPSNDKCGVCPVDIDC